VISLWIVLLRITVDHECFHCGLYYLGLLSIGLFQNTWEWTQTHCIIDDTVVIDCFHCGQYYKVLGAFLCCVFSQELLLEALPPLPKAAGSGLATWPNVVGFGCQVWLKTLPKRINNVRSCCPAGPNSVTTLQKGAGSGCPARPSDIGCGWAAGPNILRSGCVAIPNDIIICIINI
jgi:hypothetical protein